MEIIAQLILDVLKDIDDERTIKKVRKKVKEFCAGFPLFAWE